MDGQVIYKHHTSQCVSGILAVFGSAASYCFMHFRSQPCGVDMTSSFLMTRAIGLVKTHTALGTTQNKFENKFGIKGLHLNS